METKDAAKAGAAIAVLAVAIGIGVSLDPKDPGVTEKTLTRAKSDGDLVDAQVFRQTLVDGGSAIVAVKVPRDGGAATAVILDKSPCAKRPSGVLPALCSYKVLGGDKGTDNVMQDGEWFGVGCIEVPCVVMFGEAPP